MTTLPPLSLHGASVFSLLLLSKDYRETGRGEKREKTQNFFLFDKSFFKANG